MTDINQKSSGSYYTPISLVDFMVGYVSNSKESQTVLEPSFGDGRFLSSLTDNFQHVDAIDIYQSKIDEYTANKPENIDLICDDFIDFSLTSNKKYDLIIGNPPYIKKHALSQDERFQSLRISDYFNLPPSVFQNIWVSFVLGSIKLLASEGTIFFVLPLEFLQVQYAEVLRDFLEKQFNTIEIFTFNEMVFDNIEQDVCLVLMTNKPKTKPIIRYTLVNNHTEMKKLYSSKISRNKPLKKWSNAILHDDEVSLLKYLAAKYTKIGSIGYTSPGIVTGANQFFTLTQYQVNELECKNLCLPTLLKSSFVGNLLSLNSEDLKKISDAEKPFFLLNLAGVGESTFPPKLLHYLEDGREDAIHLRYKCRIRERWFDVPIISSGDLMFFKRFNAFPKLIINEENIHTTDAAYNIRLDKNYDRDSVAFCFYNSLTLTLCEFLGRFYGGGVNELVPSEFKDLSFPYKKVNKRHIKKLDTMLRNNTDIGLITDYVDQVVFDDVLTKHSEELKVIKRKLLKRRFKRLT